MRNILFRGKDKDDGRWYEGGYVKLSDTTYCFTEDYERARMAGRDPEHHYIIFDRMTDWGLPNRHLQAEVMPESVCEFTGRYDANRKPIFEQDVLLVKNTKTGNAELYLVAYSEEAVGFAGFQGKMYAILGGFADFVALEVVGKAIDNPELTAQIPQRTPEGFIAELERRYGNG